MMRLVLVFCLAASPRACVRVQQVGASMGDCLGGAQERAGDWLRRHPGFRLRAWACRLGGDGKGV
ncbi:MAG: hypothetical protein KGH75_00995 [Rhodospirillales bacterium]|nr:hypothetical protein [Rhodospirillales bacterium]